jgi:hypothetical protein
VKKGTRVTALLIGTALAVASISACTGTNDPAQQKNQDLSQQIETSETDAVPFPLQQMKDSKWLEANEVKESLLRQSNIHALRYVTVFTQSGQVMMVYTIEGMVFSPNSQLTNTQDVVYGYANSAASSNVVDSPGDNGTYGPEAGDAEFFTSTGVMVVLSNYTNWIETDARPDIVTQPLLTIGDTPTSNYHSFAGK